jgi:membrane protease YdiL (CAAX protease family)
MESDPIGFSLGGDSFVIWSTTGYLAAGVGIYLAGGVVAMWIIRRFAADLSSMEGRVSAPVLLIGGGANLLILLGVILLVPALLDKPVSSLFLRLSASDVWFSMLVFSISFFLAVVFVYLMQRGSVRITRLHRSGLVLLGVLVLLIVSLQEEFLFRGYTRVVLAGNSAWSYLLISTGIFVAIHFLTNKVTLPQVVSWIVGGGLLGSVFLISGSIWTAVVLHFAIDASNLLVFDITGQGGFLALPQAITEGERMGYRFASGGIVLLFAWGWYGT